MTITMSKLLCTAAISMLLFALGMSDMEYAYVPGEIYIAGLFQIQTENGGQCDKINVDSVMTLEAIRWYIQQLNKKGSLPFQLGFKGYKTCGIPGKAADLTLDIISHQTCNQDRGIGEFLAGFIGPAESAEAKKVASVLSSTSPDNMYLQMSVSATATDLGNRTKYPNVYMVIPDDSKQIKTMILLMKELDWNRIGIIYEDDINGRNLAVSLQDLAQKQAICVSKSAAVQVNEFGDIYQNQINEALREILMSEPIIEGVVFFGSKKVARNVLDRSSNQFDIAKIPAFILPKSVELDLRVFHSVGSDSVLTKTKGSLIVSPPYSEIVTFTEYWKSLFTIMALFKKNAKLNLWLNDVFEEYSNSKCNPKATFCNAFTLKQVEEQFKMQSVHVKYGIIAVHTIAKALEQVYQKHCKTGLAGCLKKIKPSFVLDEMNGISVDFGKDFNFSVQPLATSKYTINYGRSSESMELSSNEIYQVYNFRDLPSGQPGLLKVGSLTVRDGLELNVSNIRDYMPDGTETWYPDMRKGQCPSGKKCSDCIKQNIPDLPVIIPGDLYVVGIAPVYNKGVGPSSCGTIYPEGYEIAQALQFGLEVFNSSDNYTETRSKFGKRKIGLIILNSCSNELTITRKILDLHKYGIALGHNEILNISDRILGYVGAFKSGVSVRVAQILSEIEKVQISYSSTTPILSDDSLYPYFLRVIPPDKVQAEVLLAIVEELGGKYIQVVYDERTYGKSALGHLTVAASRLKICIIQTVEVKEETESYHRYYEDIKKKPYARIIILFLHHQNLINLLKVLTEEIKTPQYQFIASDGWGKHKDLLEHRIGDGVFTVTLEIDPVPGLIPYILNQSINASKTNPWSEHYLQKRHNCYYDLSYDKTFPNRCSRTDAMHSESRIVEDNWINFAAISMLSLLKASAEVFNKTCGNSDILCSGFTKDTPRLVEEMKNISMDIFGTGKEFKLFDKRGDGNVGYKIYNIQKNTSNNNALTYVLVQCYIEPRRNGKIICTVGNFDHNHGLNLNIGKVKFRGGKKIESPCPSEHACSTCLSKQITGQLEGRQDAVAAKATSETSSRIVTIVLSAVLGGLIVVLISVAVFTIKLKKELKKVVSQSMYITPTDVEQINRTVDDSYQDIVRLEETTY